LGDLIVNGKTVTNEKRKNRFWEYGLDSSGSYYGPVVGSCEYGNELSDMEYLNSLSVYSILKKDSALWS
jgi:hypothetical protein